MSVGKKLDKISPEVKRLMKEIETRDKIIAGLQEKKIVIPTGRKKTRKGTYNRVIVTDNHGCYADPVACEAFYNDLEILKPREVVHCGDIVEAGGFLAKHHKPTYIEQTEYSWCADTAAANDFLDNVQQRTGKVDFYLVEGNHDHRPQSWIVEQTCGKTKDAEFLHRIFGLENVLGLKKRGIQLIERDKTYGGLRKRGAIKLGKCLFMHGTRTGIYAAKQTLEDVACNVVFGHVHRITSFTKETIDSLIVAHSIGCMCLLNPLYGDTRSSHHAHAYAVQVVSDDGSFFHITVPIINGESYLKKLMGT